MWRAFFKALFAAVKEYLHEQRLERDYREALLENAKFDAELAKQASREATRKRMQDAEAMLGDDPAAIREFLRNRDAAGN